MDATQPNPTDQSYRFTVQLVTRQGEVTRQMQTQDQPEAFKEFLSSCRSKFGDTLGPGSYAALVDTHFQFDSALVAEGRGTYAMKFKSDVAREYFELTEKDVREHALTRVEETALQQGLSGSKLDIFMQAFAGQLDRQSNPQPQALGGGAAVNRLSHGVSTPSKSIKR